MDIEEHNTTINQLESQHQPTMTLLQALRLQAMQNAQQHQAQQHDTQPPAATADKHVTPATLTRTHEHERQQQ